MRSEQEGSHVQFKFTVFIVPPCTTATLITWDAQNIQLFCATEQNSVAHSFVFIGFRECVPFGTFCSFVGDLIGFDYFCFAYLFLIVGFVWEV